MGENVSLYSAELFPGQKRGVIQDPYLPGISQVLFSFKYQNTFPTSDHLCLLLGLLFFLLTILSVRESSSWNITCSPHFVMSKTGHMLKPSEDFLGIRMGTVSHPAAQRPSESCLSCQRQCSRNPELCSRSENSYAREALC